MTRESNGDGVRIHRQGQRYCPHPMKIKANKQAARDVASPGWLSLLRLNAYELGRFSVGDLCVVEEST